MYACLFFRLSAESKDGEEKAEEEKEKPNTSHFTSYGGTQSKKLPLLSVHLAKVNYLNLLTKTTSKVQ